MEKNTQPQEILLALGTNTGDATLMRRAQERVSEAFPGARFTRVARTQAVGISSPDFLNCLASARTTAGYPQLAQWAKNVEADFGDTPERHRQGLVTMDIDILRLGGHVYHADDWRRSYIQELLKELT